MSAVNDAVVELGGMAAATFSMMHARHAQGESLAPLIVVTSARAGEGKTFVALGLSAQLARLSAKRILLVDANPARPAATARFNASGRAGLVELLSAETKDGGVPLEPVATRLGNLSVLGIGRGKPDPTVMFRDGALDRLFAWASQRCDLCVVDAGPLCDPGVSLLVSGATQNVLVVDSQRTSRDAAAEAVERSGRKAQAWGVVLNRRAA